MKIKMKVQNSTNKNNIENKKIQHIFQLCKVNDKLERRAGKNERVT